MLAPALLSCARTAPEDRPAPLRIPISMEQPDGQTKVDVTLNTGALSWSDGDHVAVYITGAGEFRNLEVTSNSVFVSLAGEESLDEGYSFYPTTALVDGHGTGETPWVSYPASYNLSSITETSTQTTVLTPMIAKNSMNGMKFYQTGGMVRMHLSNVPENTNKIVVTFNGMTDVVGTCSVTNPGTATASTSIVVGGGAGNVITFTGYTEGRSYLTIPLPSIDFSALTSVMIEAYEDSTRKAVIIKNTSGWGVLKHGYGRLLPVDFTGDLLNAVRMETTDVTLWRSETLQRKAKPIYADGLPYTECTLVWSTTDSDVVDLNTSTGELTAEAAGEATITATATADVDGQETVKSSSFTVYVNEITAVSLVSSKASIAADEQATLTATITNTDYGDIAAHPRAIIKPTFTSSSSDDIATSSVSDYMWLTESTFQVTCVVIGGASKASGATLTVTLPAKYCTGGTALSDSVSID